MRPLNLFFTEVITSSLDAGLFGSTFCKGIDRVDLDGAAIAAVDPEISAAKTIVVSETLLRKMMLNVFMVFPNLY